MHDRGRYDKHRRGTRRGFRLGALTVGLGLVLTACPADEPEAEDTSEPAPETEEVEEVEEAEGEVTIAGSAFSPSQLEVAVGTEVVWVNDDSLPHTVTFEDGVDSGSLQQGDTFSRTFDEPGEYPYVCTIHPGMTATVTVTDG